MQRSRVRCSALVACAATAALLGATPVCAGMPADGLAIVHAMASLSLAITHLVQVNVLNVSSAGAGPGRTDLVVQGRLLDASGTELARSESRTLPRGATFSWTISRAALAGATRDSRGRAQVRAEVDIVGVQDLGAFVPSLELTNELTGGGSGLVGDIRTIVSAEADLTGTVSKDFY